jgi:hypothetical protein
VTNHISEPYLPHVPTEANVRKINKIREAAIEMAHLLEEVPDPRYKALAKTSLEESTMWAVKGHALAKEL